LARAHGGRSNTNAVNLWRCNYWQRKSNGSGSGRLVRSLNDCSPKGRPTRRSTRRTAVAWPPLPRLRQRDALRRAAGADRPCAGELQNVGTTALTLECCVIQESYVWLCAAARLPSAGCTICVGRSSLLREQAQVTARARDTASGGSPARHARACCSFWEGCSSLLARSVCTLSALRQELHRPGTRSSYQSCDQRSSA